MAYATQPIREQLFIRPKWRSGAAKRSGPMMAYDGMSPLETGRPATSGSSTGQW